MEPKLTRNIIQIAGAVADQEGFTEDTDPAEEDSEVDGREQRLPGRQ